MENTNRRFQISERACIGTIVVLIAIVIIVISYFEWKGK
jgi:preprotein translocase subunit SecF